MKHALTLACALALSAVPASAHTGRDLVDLARASDSFGTLTAALEAADLVDALRGDDPLTVFAPTDEAFAKLPDGTVELLLRPENRESLVALLTYHVVAGDVSALDAAGARRAHTLQGEEIAFDIRDGRLRAAGANVLQNDLEATNGRIHVVDSVLMPPGFGRTLQGRKVVGVYLEHPSRALAAQLGVDRSKSQVITKLTSGGSAEKAGLRRYDVIVAIDGRPAKSGSIDEAKKHRAFGETIPITIVRRGATLTYDVPVGLERH